MLYRASVRMRMAQKRYSEGSPDVPAIASSGSVRRIRESRMSTKHTQPLASAITAVAVFVVVLALAMALA